MLTHGPFAFYGNAPFKGLCCRCSFEHCFVKSGVGQFGYYLLKGLVGFVVVFLPPTFCVDGPAVGRVLYSQSVVDHIDLLYLEVTTDLRLRIGRFVADSEANKLGSGTYFDIFHSSKRERVQQCRLLLMTGGSCAGDRASPFSTLETWQQKLVMVVIDEGQQYGGDREVASVAMLPSTCMVVWTEDVQQTPGGIAKGPSQIAITRRQLISRKHALRCPQEEYTPHTLYQALLKIVSQLDLPVVADMKAMFQLAVTDLGPLWHPTEMSAHRECLDILGRVCPDCTLRWDEPTADDVQGSATAKQH